MCVCVCRQDILSRHEPREHLATTPHAKNKKEKFQMGSDLHRLQFTHAKIIIIKTAHMSYFD